MDLPGCYSLMAHSGEEAVARNFVCSDEPNAVVVVCDATCLERNLNLALQVLEVSSKVVVCVNLMDEAKRKGIEIDTRQLSRLLKMPVIGTQARGSKDLGALVRAIAVVCKAAPQPGYQVSHTPDVLCATQELREMLNLPSAPASHTAALQLLTGNAEYNESITQAHNLDPDEVQVALEAVQAKYGRETLVDAAASAYVHEAERIAQAVSKASGAGYDARDRRIDDILTGKWTAFPAMFLLLALTFFITMRGANYPSELLSRLLFGLEDILAGWCVQAGVTPWVSDLLLRGAYHTLAWVVAVMLPPMAIFFPLFTLLEDLGYLPRVAFNLDRYFSRCNACGKQALTMCMGFGCNAAGVVSCRIIDSRREKFIAILTNNFVPCNGRFPILISVLSMFFVFTGGLLGSALSAALLSGLIVLSVGATLLASKLLSATILKGYPSSFTLELPPYRKPQIGRVLVSSMVDRALFVLGRAALVAAPAGLVLWCSANLYIGGASILSICANFLDPFASLLGLDGVVLLAFILGLPANEIVMPIIVMAYMAQGTLTSLPDLGAMKQLLLDHGWTWVTALCVLIFSIMHWPCSTTLLTIKKEAGGVKWMLLAALLPTAFGVLLCMAVNFAAGLFMG